MAIISDPNTRSTRLGCGARKINHLRFPLRLELSYREIGQRRPGSMRGVGTSKIISAAEIVFTTHDTLEESAHLEVLADWPARLDGTTWLRLAIQGRVVRSADGHTAVAIERHEFRTRSASAQV